ncbi:phage tail tube protein [Caulobacter sp. RHG1]|uniref:phage tail tube protein n=1 Tax=Caulobacter sp. (strain RHG1) TaxID=2545762 RepID=UPI001553E0A8|nr:phage tail tube protein [Caulobacter sp. RHG1]NQE62955.1 hypothetical protein [Caulobacter sp. RHG1]
MANAQGVKRKIKRVKQAIQGTPVTAGSQLIRRTSFTMGKASDTYENNEIVDHQQSTGQTEGTYSTSGKLDGLLSPATYVPEFENLLRKDAAATAALAGMSITIAAAGQAWTISRAAGSFLTDGVKQFDLVRLPTAAFNAANKDKNLLVTAVTALALTVIPLNGAALVPEGPIAAAGLTVPGKKIWVPTSGHTDTFFTWEDWSPDVPSSKVYPDVKVGAAQITIPATGNPTVSFDLVGLSRTLGTAEILTAPTAATTTAVLSDAVAKVIVGNTITPITSGTINITGNVGPGEAEVGSQARSGHQLGRIGVTVSITAKFGSLTLAQIRENQNIVAIAIPIPVDGTANAEFVTIVLPAVKLFTDDTDDGEKEIIGTYNGTAQIPATGGAALANHQTIVSLQDSMA